MRTRIILSMLMVFGAVCLPAAAEKKLRPTWMTVKLDGDANGAVVTGISPDANAPGVVETKTIRLTLKLGGDANGLVVTGMSPDGNGAVVTLTRPDWGYVGIQVTPVPAAVASQLRLKDEGVMIRNVAKGSPADKAGIDRYDVIVALGKDKPAKNVAQFILAARKCKPGEALALTVIRGGRQEVIDLTLGERPRGKIAYVYEEDPDDQVQDEFRFRRGLMRKEDGKWVFDTPGVKSIELPIQILRAMPNGPWGNIRVQTQITGDPNHTRQVSVTSVTNVRTLSIKSGAKGTIEVTRTTPDGKRETATYDDADQLKQKDAEAFDLYQKVPGGKVKLGGEGMGMSILSGLKPVARAAAEAGAGPAEIQAVAEELQKELERHLRELAEKTRLEAQVARGAIARAIAPVSRQFDVDEKGRIQVRVLKDGNELNMTFAGQAEMKKKSPKLYEEYMKLLDSREDGK